MSTQQFDNALHMMEAQGGSFVRALVDCYYRADPANKTILKSAFAHYFDEYEQRFRRHSVILARAQGEQA